MDASTIVVYSIPLIFVIMGLVQVAKGIGFPARYAGVLALAIGIGIMLLYTYYQSAPWLEASILGAVAGLAASGGWSTGKNAAGH